MPAKKQTSSSSSRSTTPKRRTAKQTQSAPATRKRTPAKPAATTPAIAPATGSKPSSRAVAAELLAQAGGGPMKVTDLAELVVKSGRCELGGKTPIATVGAQVYLSAKDPDGLFVKAGRGEVSLRQHHPADHRDGVIGGAPSERDQAVADTNAVVEHQSRKRTTAKRATRGKGRASA